LQIHVVLAGLTMAVVLGALGLSVRKLSVREWGAKPRSDFGRRSGVAARGFIPAKFLKSRD
jgi:hypothetical protein